jgi:hypothetical protein
MKGLKAIFKKVHVVIFLLMMLICGSLFGFVETFLFVFLKVKQQIFVCDANIFLGYGGKIIQTSSLRKILLIIVKVIKGLRSSNALPHEGLT